MRAAMNQFAQVARGGKMPAELRSRFALANAQVGAQREALIRASALVEQNLEILLPKPVAETSVYSAAGAAARAGPDDRVELSAPAFDNQGPAGPFSFPGGP